MNSRDILNESDFRSLALPVRTNNALKTTWMGSRPIATVGDLINLSARELLLIPGFGAKSLGDVRAMLGAFGLYLRGEDLGEAERLEAEAWSTLREATRAFHDAREHVLRVKGKGDKP